MEDRQDISELIERYVQGKLQRQELEQFRDLLAGEKGEEIKAEIHHLHLVKKITTEYEEANLQKKAQTWIKEIEADAQPQQLKISHLQTSNRKWYYLSGIAASIALLLFSINLFFQPPSPPPDTLAQAYWSDNTRLNPTIRGGDIHEAFSLFNSQQYTQTIESLSGTPTSSPIYINALLISGASFYMLQKVDTAKTIFQKAINHNESLLVDEAKWRLALVYVLENNYNAAKNILNELQHLRGYQSKATELLKSLPR